MTFEPAAASVAEAVERRAAEGPERPAVTVWRPAAGTAESLGYAELAARVRRRAARLAATLGPGERVLIALPTGVPFVEIYLACLAAGLVAVPLPPVSGSTAAGERVAAVAADCSPGLAFAEAADHAAIAERLAACGLDGVPVEAPDAEYPEAAAPPGSRRPGRDSLAVLQYSSGSTGDPKGVMLTHGDILDDLGAMRRACALLPGEAVGMWIPLHHDMGLFAHLTMALLAGAHVVMMTPNDFVRRPVEWLRMLDRYGCVLTAGPDFAYDMCLRLIPDEQIDGLDLSALRIALDGSEPIHVPTMTAFTDRFARAGLRAEAVSPGYGLAEATVYVTLKEAGAKPSVLGVDPARAEAADDPRLSPSADGAGRLLAGHSLPVPGGPQLRIVDPATARPRPDGAIGEIWLRGDGIGRGYWNRPELSAATFAARLADGAEPADAAGPGRGWLRTGDLGAVLDGQLYVTGRIKEMMVVRGRNLFPQDVEREARRAHPALAGYLGAAFAVPGPVGERIVLVHEVGPQTPPDALPEAAGAVIRLLTAELGIPVRNVALVRRGTVHRTTSGKIQRTAMRERFLAGRVRPLHARLDADLQREMP